MELTSFDRIAIYYLACRRQGKRAIEAYIEAKEMIARIETLKTGDPIVGRLIDVALPGALAMGMAMHDLYEALATKA